MDVAQADCAMAWYDLEYAPLGALVLAAFLGAAHAAWPSLAAVFVGVGFILCAWRAIEWARGGASRYRKPFRSGFATLLNPAPFYIPLGFDLLSLVILESLLRQTWFNVERGSRVAAVLILCVTTPVILIGARFIGKPLIMKSMRPFRKDAEMPGHH
jgi:hypothetical protein